MNTKLTELKEAMAGLDKKFNELKAGPDIASPDRANEILDVCYNMVSNLRQYVYAIDDALYKHQTDGHLPPIKGAERMNKALKACGLDGDYTAEPRSIFASCKYVSKANKNGQKEIELIKNKQLSVNYL